MARNGKVSALQMIQQVNKWKKKVIYSIDEKKWQFLNYLFPATKSKGDCDEGIYDNIGFIIFSTKYNSAYLW